MAYTTNTLLKTYLNITGSGDDTLLTTLIARAQKYIDSQTGRTFEAGDDSTRYFVVGRDTDGPILYFDADLASITSITNGDATTVTNSQYTTAPRNVTPYYAVKLRGDSGVAWSFVTDPDGDPITVVGKWAYSTTAPDDVIQACTALAAYLYRRRDSIGTDTDRAIATGDGVVILGPDVPQIVKDVIRIYKRRI